MDLIQYPLSYISYFLKQHHAFNFYIQISLLRNARQSLFYKLINKMLGKIVKEYKICLFVAVLLILIMNVQPAPCPQLCQTCTAGVCSSCFQDWTSGASTTSNSNCNCPVGYYMNSTTRICNFCPAQCITCLSYSSCTSCLSGYKLKNGYCVSNFNNSTIQFGFDLNGSSLSAISTTNLFGYSFVNSAATTNISNYYRNCSGMAHQPMIGQMAFDYDTIIYKSYYGLPFHQWAHLKFQFFVIDEWRGQQLIVQIQGQRNAHPTSLTSTLFNVNFMYDQSIRNMDFCSLPQFKDNLGIFNQSFMHTDSILKFRVKTSLFGVPQSELPSQYRNIYFGIRQVSLIIGVCPENCLTCASRERCGSCTPLFNLDSNFKCQCDTTVAYLTQKGECIKKCSNQIQIFVNNKCSPCGQIFPSCLKCVNRNATATSPGQDEQDYICIECTFGKFLFNGTCISKCPAGYYQKFTTSVTSPQICLLCPLGCLFCEGNQFYTSNNSLQVICESCIQGYLWQSGVCFNRTCPIGTYPNLRSTVCLQCPVGCSSCTSAYYCTSCIQNTSSPVIYVNRNGVCVLVCNNLLLTIYNPSYGCENVTCSPNCLHCFGPLNNQCFQCISPYFQQNYQCVSSCSPGYYLQSTLSRQCVKCRPECAQCILYSCSKCNLGYWLYNAQCVRICPFQFYPSTAAGNYKCLPCQDSNCNLCSELPASLATLRNSTSQCLQCKFGYFLDPLTNDCVKVKPVCPISYYYNQQVMDCVKCPANCVACQLTLCLLCQPPKILNNGQCVDQCPVQKIAVIQNEIVVNITLNITYFKCVWADPLCQVYSSSTPPQCSQCIYLSPSLVLYQSNVSSKCLFSCPDGYTRSSSIDQSCIIACSSNCVQCQDQSTCKKCNSGFLIYLGACVTTCPDYHFSDSIQCIKCDTNCLKCQQDGRCIRCQSGLVLSPTGNCYSSNCVSTQSQYNNSILMCPVCTSPCATCTTRSTQCTSCILNMLLQPDFTCAYNCSSGFFADVFSRQCRPCRPTCLKCLSFQNCTQCIQDYYLFKVTTVSAYCISQCPSGTYISTITQNLNCQACAFPCLTCFGPNNFQCLQCISGFKMDHTTCVAYCPLGKYADQYGHCDLCHYSCKQCFGPADFQCASCHKQNEDDYHYFGYRYQGKCYKDGCPISSYYHQDDDECVECSQNCLSCQDNNECSLCNEHTILYNKSCIQICPESTFFNSTLNKCTLCAYSFSSQCDKCNGVYGCVKCKYPYFRYNKTCVSVCPTGTYVSNNDDQVRQCLPCPQSCVNCTSPTSCKACKNRIKLQDGVCLNKCSLGQYYNMWQNSCVSCPNSTIPNCAGCYYNTTSRQYVCVYCDEGYVLIRNSSNLPQCVQKSPNGCLVGYYFLNISSQCQKCHISCVSCSNFSTNCTQCQPGLVLVNNLCVNSTVPPTCVQNCSSCSNATVCIICHLPFYLDTTKGTCVATCPSQYLGYLRECVRCKQGCLSCYQTPDHCTSCKSGYYLLDQNCLRECPYGYFNTPITNYTGVCESCLSYMQGCQLCLNSTACSLCQSQYSLHQETGKCYKKPICPLNYFFSYMSSGCGACPSNCIQCMNGDTCIICQPQYIRFNNTCINTTVCPIGSFIQITQYTISSMFTQQGKLVTGSQCSTCVPPCLSCSNSQTCLSCLQGYILSNNTCVTECGVQYFAANTTISWCQPCSQQCLSCRTNSTTCTACRDGYYLFSKSCVAKCPIGLYESIPDRLCRECGPYCVQCLNYTNCQVCFDGLWLLDGSCVTYCPTGYAGTLAEQTTSTLFNKVVSICVKCQYPCSSCSKTLSQYQCQSCVNGFYLYETRCLQNCPAGFFANPSTARCSPCPSWCQSCTSYSSCQQCAYNQCQQFCQTLTPSTCALCETACKTCDKSTIITYSSSNKMGTCLQCFSPYYLSNSRCVLSCPTGTYLNFGNSTCYTCPCNQCANDGSCIACSTTEYLYIGKCYSICPAGTIAGSTFNQNLNINQKICIINPCISSSSSSGCTYCMNPYLLYNQQCILTCPNGTYESSSSNTCQKCPIECLSCTGYNNCTVCRSGYYMQKGTLGNNWICVQSCSAGFYLTYLNTSSTSSIQYCQECSGMITGCKLCQDLDTCLICQPGTYIYLNSTSNSTICVSSCPVRYFLQDTTCTPCLEPSCLRCTYSQIVGYECKLCVAGMYLVSSLNKCVLNCSQGYYPISTNNSAVCQLCPPQCLTCLDADNCIRCSVRYSFDLATKKCTRLCPLGTFSNYNSTSLAYQCRNCSISPGCADCIPDISTSAGLDCIVCSQGWKLLNGICYQNCPSGYLNISGVCRRCDSICLQCSTSPSNCTKCYAGFTYIATSGTCSSQCLSRQFFQVSTQTCQSCSTECLQCFGPRYDQCVSCSSPLKLIGNLCIIDCPSGYIQSAGYCIQCDVSCKQCTGFGSANQCTSCPIGTFLYIPVAIVPPVGQCLKSCPISTYQDSIMQECLPCSQSMPNCVQCLSDPTARCTKCQATAISVIINNILYCQPSNYVCPQYQMYVNSANLCVQCPQPCISCALTISGQMQCYKCSAGYVWQNGQCLTQCSQFSTQVTESSITYNGVALNNIQTCLQCPVNCIQCQRNLNNSIICLKCNSPYILYSNTCIQSCGDPSLTLSYNPNSLLWQCTSQIQNIQSCQSKGLFSMVNSTGQTVCVDSCPNGYYTDSATSSCLICPAGCKTCTSSISCISCQIGFYLLNGLQCVSQCPSGYFGIQNICYSCVSPCLTCTGGLSRCASCLAGYKLLQGSQCVQTCPAGYYQPPSTLICSACDPKCATCSSGTECLTCINSVYAPPTCSDTTNRCLSYQYAASSTSCANCWTTCATCYGPSSNQCLSCNGSLIFMSGTCLTSCLNGYYSYTNSAGQLACALCSTSIPNCGICSLVNSATVSCTSCNSPYLLSPDGTKCVSTCSQLNTNATIYSVDPFDKQKCVVCISNCNVCSNQICVQCKSGFSLLNLTSGQQCSNTCPPSTFSMQTSTGYQCLPCGANCLTCANSQVCYDCANGFVLNQGACVSNCGSNTGLYPALKTITVSSVAYTEYSCTPCNNSFSYCTACQYMNSVLNTSLACTQCSPPYLVLNGACTSCQSSYFYESSTQTCKACSSNCLTCTSLTQCTVCSNGYYLHLGMCFVICPSGTFANSGTGSCQYCVDPRCSTCTASSLGNSCSSCQTGYYIISAATAAAINYTGSQCVQFCPSGSAIYNQLSCQPCLVNNCKSCSVSLSVCQQCATGLFLLNNKCQTACPAGTAPYIDLSGPDYCLDCKTGCELCPTSVNTCNQCKAGLSNVGDGSCSYNSNNATCPSGQYVAQVSPLICSPCHSTCQQCIGASASQCILCSQNQYALQNGYCVLICSSSQFYNTFTNQCENCNSVCKTCSVSSTNCTSCPTDTYLTSFTCSPLCPSSTYRLNTVCEQCPNYCLTCISQTNCTSCSLSASVYYNNVCYNACPTGTYVTSASPLNSCTRCPTECLSCTSSSSCQSCSTNYYLYLSQCITQCPSGYYQSTNPNTCNQCSSNCFDCTSSSNCVVCEQPYALYNAYCTSTCPPTTYNKTVNSQNICQSCSTDCLSCSNYTTCNECQSPAILLTNYSSNSKYCVSSCPSGYTVAVDTNGDQYCHSDNCNNCVNCPQDQCNQCQSNYYLQNGACGTSCLIGYFGDNATWQCTVCMQNCIECPNATYCNQCASGFNFSISLDNKCVSQAIFMYGPIANISGFTSNITQVTSLVYLSTSAGPVFFGQMSSTYFNIQFCQFMFFHDGVAGQNSQMRTFLSSLSFMSMSNTGGTQTTTSRRLLLESQPLSFLQINVPIFIMMGCFLAIFGIVHIIQRNIDSMCLTCPNFNFYVKQICIYLANRFKWIYFDFVVWLSYLPFLYFSIVQVQKFNFDSGLQGFSSILSVIILIAYPLYPVLICYNIKKNYVALCMQNDKMVQMSLSPWVYKVKRPDTIPTDDVPFVYFSKANFRLLYYPLKYFRKFIFVLVVTVCPLPVASLCILLGLNIVFIGYMAALRPRLMPYMIFDFIIQGVMLAFEIFMVIYMILDSVKITAMSIATHAFGFISANLSIIVAIVLNIVAYYKIFMCIYELYQHLKEKVQQKQKLQAKQKDPAHEQIMSQQHHNNNQFLYNEDFQLDEKQLQANKKHRNDDSLTEQQAKIENLGKPQRDIANLLSDKDLLMNNIQPRYDGQIENNDNFKGLFDDKELYGDQIKKSAKNGEFEVYDEDELPTYKIKKGKNDKSNSKDSKKNPLIAKKQQQLNLKGQSTGKSNKNINALKNPKSLDQTNQFMIRSKQEHWQQPDNEISEQRLFFADNKKNAKSMNQANNNSNPKLIQANRIYLKQGDRKISNPSKNQDLLNGKLIQNKKGQPNKNESAEKLNKNESQLSLASQKSNEDLLSRQSPNKKGFGKQNQGNFTNIEVKQAAYQQKSRKPKRAVQNQFDEFEQTQLQKVERKNKNKQNGLDQQAKQQASYKQRNKNNKLGNGQKGDGIFNQNSKKRDDNEYGQAIPNIDLVKRNKLKANAELEDDDLNAIKMYNRNKSNNQLKNKAANQSSAIEQLKTREKSQNKKQQIDQLPNQSNVANLSIKQRRNKVKAGLFFDEEDEDIQNAQFDEKQRARNKNSKNSEQIDQGLLVSRKPAKNARNQQQNGPADVSTKLRENKKIDKKHDSNNLPNIQSRQLREGYYTEKIRSKPGQLGLKRNVENEDYQYEDVSYRNHENNKYPKSYNQPSDGNQYVKEALYSQRIGKQIAVESKEQNIKNKQQAIEQLNTIEREKNNDKQQDKQQAGGFFSNLFGLNKKSSKVQNQNQQQQQKPQKKKKIGQHEQFQQSGYGRKQKRKNQESEIKKGKMNMKGSNNQFNQDYEEIKRKNKESIIKPKMNYGTLNLDQSDKFEDSSYSRPQSRRNNSELQKDSGLNMNRRGSDVSDSQDFNHSRLTRAQNKQKNRSSKSNLNIRDNSGFVDSQEVSRKKKQQQQSNIRRGGKGRLQIDQFQDEEGDDLQNIQL